MSKSSKAHNEPAKSPRGLSRAADMLQVNFSPSSSASSAAIPGLSRAADLVAAEKKAALPSSSSSSSAAAASSLLRLAVPAAAPAVESKFAILTFWGVERVLCTFECRRDTGVLSIDDLLGVDLSHENAEQCVFIAGLSKLPDLSYFQCNLPNLLRFEDWGEFDKLSDDLVVEIGDDKFVVGQRRLEREKRNEIRGKFSMPPLHAAAAAAAAPTVPDKPVRVDLAAQVAQLKAELEVARATEVQLKARVRALEQLAAGSNAPKVVMPLEIGEIELDFGAEKVAIGRGAAARVYAATFRGEPVAVKEILGHAKRAAVEQELAIAKQVAGHANLVSTFGIVHSEKALLLVMERLDQTLAEALHGNAEFGKKPVELPIVQRLRIAHSIACGVRFLHSQVPPVLHRDLKPDNVMLSADLTVVKIGDFGTSRFLEMSAHMTANVGTVQYAAPELMAGEGELTTAIDVYSFAILLWELFSATRPLSELQPAQVPMAVCMRKQRPAPEPQSMPEAVRALMEACWSGEARERPPMAAAVRVLSQALRKADDAAKLDVESRQLCIVCADHARTTALVPCGHLCACDDCQPGLKDCPICRTPASGKLRIFNA